MKKNNRLMKISIGYGIIPLLVVCCAGMFGFQTAQPDFSAWKYRLPITLVHRDSGSAGIVPVDVTFTFFADRCQDPRKEIRLVLKNASGETEVPFQLSRISRWIRDTDGNRSLPAISGMITFFDEAPGAGDAEYFLLYGNTEALAPVYPSDLKVTGQGPAWVIENNKMTVRLHGKKAGVAGETNHDSGQLSAVILKGKPKLPFETAENVMHWNPDVFVPMRGWLHPYVWDPPEVYEIETGPIFVNVRRSGPFPLIPEVHLAVDYRVFTNRAYVESGTVLSLRDDIGVVALRNDQLIFRKDRFTHVGWDDDGKTATRPLDGYKPVNKHGDILRIPAVADFVTFFNPSRGVGAATVRDLFSAVGPNGSPPTLFDTATYITNGDLQYWFRPLVYFHVDWDRKQLITVPKGSVYSERNYYLFYEPKGSRPVAEVESLSRAVKKRPGLKIGEYALPPER